MANEAVLVTGATGFIGRHLVSALRDRGYAVHEHSVEDGNIAYCTLPFQGVQHVFHLAGRTFVPDSWERPRDFYETNTLGTANVLEFCRRERAPVTLISSYVYGKPSTLPIAEDAPVTAFNPYGHSKILAEEIAAYYRDQFGLPVTIVRPFNIYGPGQAPSFLIPTLIRQALDPVLPAVSVADGRPRRDFIHVRDLIALLLATMTARSGGTLNAGSGRSVSIAELVELINQMVPRPKPLISRGEPRPDDVLDVVADISRARTELNWQPCIALADGLRETIESMRSGA